MRIDEIIARVKQTQSRLRKDVLRSVLEEFDGGLMQLEETMRRRKYAKMGLSAFSFFRGSAYLFYFDVSREWFPYHTLDDRATWIQGDLHFENFGAFRSENGRIVYDVNDFDEGYLGSYLYDVLRMSVSVALVADQLGADASQQQEAIRTYAEAYCRQISRFSKRKEDPRTLVFDKGRTQGTIRKLLKKTEKRLASQFLEGVTTLTRTARQFTRSEELVPLTPEERLQLEAAWPAYVDMLTSRNGRSASYYTIKDVAVKHGSGTGSIGLDRYYVLIEGDDGEHALDDVVVEVKEVRAPIPAYFLPYHEPFWTFFGHQGKRVIVTQQAMHHEADPYLGYLTMDGRHFYARERSPYKKKLKVEKLTGLGDLHEVLELMGKITAKLHARADADMQQGLLAYHSEDEIYRAIGGDTDAFCEYIANWSVSYARQVHEDYGLFLEWAREREAETAGEEAEAVPVPTEA